MLVATITDAKNRLSALIDHVKSGESVLIVDRGIPVARLESAFGVAADTDGRIARLARAGTIRAAQAAGDRVEVVTLDDRMAAAVRREGFTVRGAVKPADWPSASAGRSASDPRRAEARRRRGSSLRAFRLS